MLLRNRPNKTKSDPRERIDEVTPSFFKPFFTWLTTKPSKGETPRRKTVTEDLIFTITVLLIGPMTGYAAFTYLNTNPFAIIFSWLCIIYSTRKLRLTIEHACSHNAVLNHRFWNRLLGEAISILTLTIPFAEYKKKHTKGHHSQALFTPGDETYDFLFIDAGFRLDMTPKEAWRHLLKTLFSLAYYCRQFYLRLKLAFFSSYITHNVVAAIFWLSILLIVHVTNSWLIFLWIWVIPMTTFFEASSLLRQCVEHRFGDNLQEMTSAILCGEEPPILEDSDSTLVKFLKMANWWLRIFFYHLPVRLLVLTGDSPVHDYHHRRPNSDYVNAYLDRQNEVQQGINYSESWGLLQAINKTFKSFTKTSSK